MKKLAVLITILLLLVSAHALGSKNKLVIALPEEPEQQVLFEILSLSFGVQDDTQETIQPYAVKQWHRGSHVVLEANEAYEGIPPAIQTIVIKFIPDNQARLMLLEKGEIDVLEEIETLPERIKEAVGRYSLRQFSPLHLREDSPSAGLKAVAAKGGGSRAWTILATYQIPNGSSGLAWDGSYLYSGIYGANGDEIYRIDPSDGSYTLLFTGPQGDAFGLTHDGSYLWTTDHPSNPAQAMEMDWAGAPLSSFNLPAQYMSGIAYDGGDFWVAAYYPHPAQIYLVDNTGSILRQFDAVDDQPWDLCLQGSDLWMADYYGDTLYKIDSSDGSLLDSHASEYSDPAGIVYDGTYLWYCDEGTGGYDNLYKVDLLGSGTPDINVPLTYHDFGTVTIGDDDTWNVTVENAGDDDLVISGVDFTSTDLTTTASFPMTINPSNQDIIPIVYEPTVLGALNATATINSNDPIDPETDLTIDGHGVAPGPEINRPETAHDYGAVRVYGSTQWLMEVQNLGDTTLTISGITSDDSHFSVDPRLSFPMDIAVLESVDLGIWFRPLTATTYSATLTITSNDADESPLYVTLEGSGTDAAQPIGNTLWNYLIDADPYDNSPKAMAHILDINGDGLDDVIVASEDDYVRCFNGAASGTGDVIWELEIYSGSLYQQNDLAISPDMDDDGYEDVVVGTTGGDRSIHMISGKTGEIIWTHDTDEYGDGGWVYQVDCRYDYNDDGIPDVLAATGDDSGDIGPKRVYCLNAINGVSIWERPLNGPVFSVIGVENFTADGKPDVIAGASTEDESQGRVYAISGATGNLYWNQPFNPPGTSVWALANIDDITGDAVKDVMIGDFSFSGGNFIGLRSTNGAQQFSLANGALVLRFVELDDVNSDGHPDFAAGHAGTTARVIDPYAGAFVWSHGLLDKSWNVERIADVNNDGINDVAVGTLFSNNYCYFLDGTDGSEIHSVNYGTPLDSLTTIPDVVNDGSWEMIAGGRNGMVTCLSGGTAVGPNTAPGAPVIEGPAIGKPGRILRFTVRADDKQENSLLYYIEWGDNLNSGWIGPYRSGEEIAVHHHWSASRIYRIRAKAKDPFGLESDWSPRHEVNISVIVPNWLSEPSDTPHFEGDHLETEIH